MAARCMTQSRPSRSASLDLAHVLGQISVGLDERFPRAALEEVEVTAGDEVAILLEQVDQLSSDVALDDR